MNNLVYFTISSMYFRDPKFFEDFAAICFPGRTELDLRRITKDMIIDWEASAYNKKKEAESMRNFLQFSKDHAGDYLFCIKSPSTIPHWNLYCRMFGFDKHVIFEKGPVFNSQYVNSAARLTVHIVKIPDSGEWT